MKKNNNNNLKKIIVLCIIICFFCIFFLYILLLKNSIFTQTEKKASFSSLNTIKDVVEFYNSKYISEIKSDDNFYYVDIFAELKYLPYSQDNKSNEEYYNNLLKDIAKIIHFNNYRLHDKKNEINIEVICLNNEIDTIKINGIADYFIYMDSQISMQKYEEKPITSLNIASTILQSCIENRNNTKYNFGTKDSSFEQYDIYFDEGINVRKFQKSIYNIIFTKNYKDEVFKNIHTGMTNEEIVELIGIPTFIDDTLSIIGYKSEDIYVFFNNGNISTYLIDKDVNINEFLDLVNTYLTEDNKDILGFMNNLTDIWPDYSEYEYSSNYFFIAYPLKGLEIKVNYDDTNGILVYNNIKEISSIKSYLENTDFVARLNIDGVFEAEKRRLNKDKELYNKSEEYLNSINEEEKNLIGDNALYYVLPVKDENDGIYNMKFISKTGENPNREIYDGINSFMWCPNNRFVYSKLKKGIFIYDLETGIVSRLIEGDGDFKFTKYEDGILTYDENKTVEIR